jgi:hypothetical protein
MRASGSKPPGTVMFNIEPAEDEQDSSDLVEVLDGLPLGALAFGDLEPDQFDPSNKWMELTAPVIFGPIAEWRDEYPRWREPGVWARRRIGDCYALVADSILTLSQPYPGDEEFDGENLRPELRFRVRKSDTDPEYIIQDHLAQITVILPESLIRQPSFNIGRWYARKLSDTATQDKSLLQDAKMGAAVMTVATKLLADGIRSYYPSRSIHLNPVHRFRMCPSMIVQDGYSVMDRDLGYQFVIPASLLEDPLFDLIGWYMRYLEERRSFRLRGGGGSDVEDTDLPHRCPPGHHLVRCRLIEKLVSSDSDSSEEDEAAESVNTDEYEALPYLRDSPDDSEGDLDDEAYGEEALASGSFRADESESYPRIRNDRETILMDLVHSLVESKLDVARLEQVLTKCQPFPGDGHAVDPTFVAGESRFIMKRMDHGLLEVYDRVQGFEAHIHLSRLQEPGFVVGRWYAEQCAFNSEFEKPWDVAVRWEFTRPSSDLIMGYPDEVLTGAVNLASIQVDRNKYPALQRNSTQIKGNSRILPKPIVVKIEINDHPVRALLDSGSLGDFISSTLVDQLSVTRETLASPLSLHLAVQGSRSKVNSRATVRLKYQEIDESRTFDVINLNNYDVILGTPWMYQHKICLGFNPARIVIGSENAIPLKASPDMKLMVSMLDPGDRLVEAAREELRRYAAPLCKEVSETDLPPFRAINHTIPLIDVSKTYSWRPSRCPEAFRAQWAEKRDAYLKSGRWKITPAGNTVPMMLIPKPGTNPPAMRVVVDLRERNKNTHKSTSPLPDMEGMLRRTASKPFRTLLDLKSAYEQIRIIPEHVDRSTVTTPDGNMVSLVVQQGDCNAPATHQALMNHIFSAYLGRFVDIYLDDIVVYSDTLLEHVEHVKIVLDILEREKLYLSPGKLHFIEPVLKILGRIIDDHGIRMDPDKVDSIQNWKVPTNRDLLRGFIGSVGFLADDVPNVRIPMGILSAITGDAVPFRWGYTEQRAFEEVKSLVHAARNHHRVPLDYSVGAPPIWMITDGCATGVAGIISQGPEWKTARIAAFYSAKLNPAQQNYPVHEIEMLAGVETMLRFTDILQGAQFQWLTDHKGLTHLLNQKNLSGRQARWLEKISSFTFKVAYIEGSENVVADALSRLYSFDSAGTQRSRSEFTYHDVVDDDTSSVVPEECQETLPILAGVEAVVATRRGSRVRRLTEKAALLLHDDASADLPLAEPTVSSRAGRPGRPGRTVKDRVTPVGLQEGGSIAEPSETTEMANTVDSSATVSEQHEVVLAVPNHTPESDTSNLTVMTQMSLGIDILAELRGKYNEDPLFRVILEKPNEFRNFVVSNRLIYLKENDRQVLCIPKVMVQGRSAREIVISEAHSMLAHLGASKTIDYLRDHVWWKDMVTDVKSFCETCNTCKMSKPSNQKPYGLLNPLTVPSYPWESVGIDFVGPLPESRNRDGQFDSITVVICLLTAMVHLIPSRTNYNASQIAELVFEQIYKFHGLPQNIVSDRDVLFTSTFWSRLHRLIGTKLRMSSAYHPQTDGSTERANRTITQMLRQCIQPDQKDWVSKLPAIEFAINSARSESTGYAPFFLNFGRMPRTMIWGSGLTNEYPSIRDFALQKKLALMSAHDSIIAARVKQTRDANRRRQEVPFLAGDLVYLSAKNISFKKGLARKLLPKFIGPYKILKSFGNSSFQVELPPHLKKRGIHDVFHSSLLRIHMPNDDRLFPGRMDTQLDGVGDDDEWAVDRILSHHGSRTDATFEILWKSGDTTWLPYYQITHLQALTDYLGLLGVSKIAKLSKGVGRPPLDDPQVFVGSIMTCTPSYPTSPFCSLDFPLDLRSVPSMLKKATRSFLSCIPPFFRTPFVSVTIDFDSEFGPTMPPPRCVNHPCFTRISPTHYLVRSTHGLIDVTLHVGQVADYLNYEQHLRAQKNITDFQSMPMGFLEFAGLWNDGIPAGDQRQLSYFWYPDDTTTVPTIVLSSTPVDADDFFIAPEQVGLGTPPPAPQPDPVLNPLHDEMMKEFAVVVMEQRRLKRELEGLGSTSPQLPNNVSNHNSVPNRHNVPKHNRVPNRPKNGSGHDQRQQNRDGYNHRQETAYPRGEKRQRVEPASFGQREAPKTVLSKLQFLPRPSRRNKNHTTSPAPSPVSTASSSQITTLSLPELEIVQDVTMQEPVVTTKGELPIEEIVRVA